MNDPLPVVVQELEPLMERVDVLCQELELAIKWQRPSILLAICNSEHVSYEAASVLEDHISALGHKVIHLDDYKEYLDATSQFLENTNPEKAIFFVHGLNCKNKAGRDTTRKLLNKSREYFLENQLRVVFWLEESEVVELARFAPDFWSFRHRVIDFVDSPLVEKLSVQPGDGHQDSNDKGEPINMTDVLEGTDVNIPLRDATLTSILEQDSFTATRVNLLLTLGIMHWRKGDSEKAASFLQAALEISVKIQDKWLEAVCFNAIALVKTDLGKIDDAIEAYKQAIHLAPEKIFLWNNLGDLYCELNRNDEAVDAFMKAIEYNANDSFSWNGLGNAYSKLGNYDKAIEAYNKAIELGFESGSLYSKLAFALTQEGMFSDAVPLYQKSIELLNNNSDIFASWNELGNTYRKLNDYDKAVKAYQMADQFVDVSGTDETPAADAPDTAGTVEAPVSPADASDDQGEDEMDDQSANDDTGTSVAGSLSQDVSTDGATTPGTVEVEGIVDQAAPAESGNDQPEDEADDASSVSDDSDAASAGPDGPAVADAADAASEEDGSEEDDDSSEEVLVVEDSDEEDADEDEPASVEQTNLRKLELKNANIWCELGNIYFKVGALDDALEAYNKALNLNLETGELYCNLASIYVQKGLLSEAVPNYLKAVDFFETDREKALTWDKLGDVYRQMKDYEQALAAYRTAFELDPEDTSISIYLNDIQHDLEQLDQALADEELAEELLSDDEGEDDSTDAPDDGANDEAAADDPAGVAAIGDASTDSSAAQDDQAQAVDASVDDQGSDPDGDEETTDEVVDASTVTTQSDDPVDEGDSDDGDGADPSDSSTGPDGGEVVEVVVVEGVADGNPADDDADDPQDQLAGESGGEDEPSGSASSVLNEIDLKNAHIWNELGNIFVKANAYDDAIDAYNKAMELDPNYGWTYSNLAFAYAQQGKNQEAIPLYQKSIQLLQNNREKAISWNRLGDAYRQLNDYDNAISAYQRADELNQDPQQPPASEPGDLNLKQLSYLLPYLNGGLNDRV